MKGKLVLADGSEFYGEILNEAIGFGEAVFTTGMTGYQEVLADPAYCGQIVVMTYPLIGNYGVNAEFEQSKLFIRGLVVDQLCEQPSNCRSEGSIIEYLTERKIPCLYDVDTRAITRAIRTKGAMHGVIAPFDLAQAEINALVKQDTLIDAVEEVTTGAINHLPGKGKRVVVVDYGIKKDILNSIKQSGCDIYIVPAYSNADTIKALQPAGILLSNGPGNPENAAQAVAVIKELLGYKPIFGVGLGHQLLALAIGAKTYKLKHGHRGSNNPVKHVATGKVQITIQNHGYAVDEASLAGLDLEVTHRSVNDNVIEGLRHLTLPIFSVQFYPEAAEITENNLFQNFLSLMDERE